MILSRKRTRVPADRSDRAGSSSSTGKFRSSRIRSISRPTAPVAPNDAYPHDGAMVANGSARNAASPGRGPRDRRRCRPVVQRDPPTHWSLTTTTSRSLIRGPASDATVMSQTWAATPSISVLAARAGLQVRPSRPFSRTRSANPSRSAPCPRSTASTMTVAPCDGTANWSSSTLLPNRAGSAVQPSGTVRQSPKFAEGSWCLGTGRGGAASISRPNGDQDDGP